MLLRPRFFFRNAAVFVFVMETSFINVESPGLSEL